MAYIDWLMDQVEYFDGPKHSQLLNRLNSYAYVPLMERDNNRAEDGIALRNEYFEETGDDPMIVDTPCSFLEFLVALARRMNYIYAEIHEDRTQDMFWRMMRNVGLDKLIDQVYVFVEGDQQVYQVVHIIINRTYAANGEDNLFPLKNPPMNQRNVEVWYQMNQYLAEVMAEEGRL